MSTPTPEDAQRIQAAFDRIAVDLWTAPGPALVEVRELALEVSSWTDRTAHLLSIHLAVQALRALDQVDEGTTLALLGLELCEGYPATIRAHLNLELGIGFRQLGRGDRACVPLSAALEVFLVEEDRSGEASALTELGIVHRGLGHLGTARLLLEAATIAAHPHDPERARRARREHLVTLGQAGEIGEALVGLDELAEAEPATAHSRANTLAEIGHLRSLQGNATGARSAYFEALDGYHRTGDRLGAGNAERALGSLEAQLGRFGSARRHLVAAAAGYEAAGYHTSAANAYVELALVALSEGDLVGCVEPTVHAWRTYRGSGDRLGLSLVHRVIARRAGAEAQHRLAAIAFARSKRYAVDVGSKLALANATLALAEVSEDPGARLAAAREAAAAYEEMGTVLGLAHASALAADAALAEGELYEALGWVRAGRSALRRSGLAHAAGPDRAAAGTTLVQARDRLLSVALRLHLLGHPMRERDPRREAFAIVADSGPVAIAERLVMPRGRRWGPEVDQLLAAAGGRDVSSTRRASDLGRLADMLTHRDHGDVSADQHLSPPPGAALWIGPPGPSGIPILHRIGAEELGFTMCPLSDDASEAIDALRIGSVPRIDDASILWDPRRLGWQHSLADVLLPEAIVAWVLGGEGSLSIAAHASVAHLPFEALLIQDEPLGARVAVSRGLLGAPTPNARPLRQPTAFVGFADPSIACAPELEAFPAEPLAAQDLRSAIGEDQVIWICAHGAVGPGFGGGIRTASGEPVLDAIDVLAGWLSGSVLVLEACWSGRSFGPLFGDQLSLASAALLAGAAAVVAGGFPLPASEVCTGALVSSLLRGIVAGKRPEVALAEARRAYLARAPETIDLVEGGQLSSIPARAPLAWAGLTCLVGA